MKPAVLLVEDEPAVLRTTELILERAGYTVLTAANAGDAFQILESQLFDLLLLDGIPEQEGIIQKAKHVNPNVRVALYTGNPELSDLSLVDIVFHKPILPSVLLREIAELLDNRNRYSSIMTAAA